MTSSETTFNDEELIAEALIDYTNPDTIARQNIAPNAGCDIDGTFYDVRNLVHLASSQADRIEQLAVTNEALTKERDEADDLAKAAFADGASNNIRLAETAHRIKALTKERDGYAHKLMQANNTYTEMHLEIERLSDKLATCEKYRDAYADCDRIGTQAVRDLEAKLAKAVEVIEWALISWDDHNKHGYNMQGDWVFDARATLVEINGLNKGESHE